MTFRQLPATGQAKIIGKAEWRSGRRKTVDLPDGARRRGNFAPAATRIPGIVRTSASAKRVERPFSSETSLRFLAGRATLAAL